MRRKVSEFIPSGVVNPGPELSQLEQDAKTGSGLAIGWVSTALAWLFVIGFIALVVGAVSASDASFWDELLNEFDQNYNSY
jgi:hypothetical protein